MSVLSKLGLGTVQFGLDYGISNQTGCVTEQDANLILRRFFKEGGCFLDTAPAYGKSEHVLGKLLLPSQNKRLVTKLTSLKAGNQQIYAIERAFENSLEQLQSDQIYGLLVHHVDDLKNPDICNFLNRLKSDGVVEKIGVSIYSQADIDFAVGQFKPDIIQIPFNILDRRLEKSGCLQNLKEQGIEIHARSVFLQGLLLMSSCELSDFFDPIKEKIDHLAQYAEDEKVGILELCLKFVLDHNLIDVALVGVSSAEEFNQICDRLLAVAEHSVSYPNISIDDPKILNPSCWP